MTEKGSDEATEIDCPHLTGKHNVCDICTEFDQLKKRLVAIRANSSGKLIKEIREDIQKVRKAFVNGVGALEVCEDKLKELAGNDSSR